MWGLFVLLVVGGASALSSIRSDIPPYVQARSAFAHSRLYLQQNLPRDSNGLKYPSSRQHLAMGIVVAVTAAIAQNISAGGYDDDALDILDEYVPLAWENYNELSKIVNQILAEAHAKIQPITSLMDALCRTTDSTKTCNKQVNERISSSDVYVQRRAELLLLMGRVSRVLTRNEKELNSVVRAFTSVPYLLEQMDSPPYKKFIRELANVYLLLRSNSNVVPYK